MRERSDHRFTAPAGALDLLWTLPVGSETPGRARRAVGDALAAFPRRDDVLVLVSELVTNAVRHAGVSPGDHIEIRMVYDGDEVRIEVHDPGDGFVPEAADPDPERPGGWGLHLTGLMADDWGVTTRDGTVVWFSLVG